MQEVKRNKKILGIFAICLVSIIFFAILKNSSYNGTFSFHYVYNQNTGEPISFIGSIFLYFLLWFVLGLVPSSVVFLCTSTLFFFLHKKDKQLFQSRYSPPYQDEFYFGGFISLSSTYIAVLMLMFLHISNIFTIKVL